MGAAPLHGDCTAEKLRYLEITVQEGIRLELEPGFSDSITMRNTITNNIAIIHLVFTACQ